MTIVHLVTVVITVGILFVAVPRVIFPLREIPGTFLDRAVAGFVLMLGVSTAAMYLLSALNMLEAFAFVGVWVAVWWVLEARRGSHGRLVRVAQRFFSFSDRVETSGARGVAGESVHNARSKAGFRGRNYVRGVRDRLTDPGVLLVSAALLLILGVSAWLRFRRALFNIELVPQDSYLALFATKDITAGNLLQEGIYPQGAYLFTSLIDHFYLFDTYSMVRFIGPLMNVLGLIAIYWAASRVTRNRAAGLLSTAVVGLFAGHPQMFLDWSRQIGSMTQEFAMAFGIIALVYGAAYMARRELHSLILAGVGIYLALTTHTVTLIPLAVGFAAILLVGLVTGSWSPTSFRRLVIVGIVGAVAGHIFVPLGLLNGQGFALSYFQYNPTNFAGFGGVDTGAGDPAGTVGAALSGNTFFQLGFAGALIAIAVGIVLGLRGNRHARVLAGTGAAILATMLFHDFVAVRFGLLFRVRVGYVVGQVQALAMGLGLGAIALAAAEAGRVGDPLLDRYRAGSRSWRAGLEIAAAVLALVVIGALWPAQTAIARTAGPSGYPQATRAALDIIESEERLTYTFVGASEQYQEGAFNGFHVEAWVFAKDIEYSDARDPSYEIPIPTDTIYIFAEKDAFGGPQAPFWFGATEEYYRTEEKRERIMRRILEWSETYNRYHNDIEIHYEDEDLRVYKVEREVSLELTERSDDFTDYTYRQGQLFDDDGDITADEVTPDPNAATERASAAGG